MITFAQFTNDFPEFANATQGQFNTWAKFAALMLTPVWGQPGPDADGNPTQYDLGSELFIAHNLALGMFSMQAAAQPGGIPGLNRGAINNEAAGPNSVGYDTAAGIETDAGNWNLTTYGTRFVQMARLLGAGPMQSSPGPSLNPLNGPAWPGPWPFPGYFG